jgi:hypothetical protein
MSHTGRTQQQTFCYDDCTSNALPVLLGTTVFASGKTFFDNLPYDDVRWCKVETSWNPGKGRVTFRYVGEGFERQDFFGGGSD